MDGKTRLGFGAVAGQATRFPAGARQQARLSPDRVSAPDVSPGSPKNKSAG